MDMTETTTEFLSRFDAIFAVSAVRALRLGAGKLVDVQLIEQYLFRFRNRELGLAALGTTDAELAELCLNASAKAR